MKFLTKNEIIEQLSKLPDLPVVFERDTDELRGTMVTKIEVIDAKRKNKIREEFDYGEYDDFFDVSNEPVEQVIWIS